jgi:hypothetical protein
MGRIKGRLSQVGLTVACVRDRGYVLSSDGPPSGQN